MEEPETASRPDPRKGRLSGGLQVRLAGPQDAPAIARFNDRLTRGGQSYQLPLDPRLPGEADHRPNDFPVYQQMLVVTDGEEIRAGMLQYHTTMRVAGTEREICWAHLPVSEGLVDSRYALVIFLLAKRAFADQPFQMCLGVGSLSETWARLLIKLGWSHAAVPFLVYPVQPEKVLRGLSYLRRKRPLEVAARLLASSGLSRLIGPGLTAWRWTNRGVHGYDAEPVPAFEGWADRIYVAAREEYGAAARRDAATLNILYPPEDVRFIRLRIRARSTGDTLGWVVVIHRRMSNNSYFGDLHVGTLVDGFGRPENVASLVDAGRRYLAQQGVDLIVANWSHHAWVRASRRLGFLPGPSNFFFFVSTAGTPLLELSCPLEMIHLSRGDCDGPGQLLPPLPAEPKMGAVAVG